MSTASAPRVWIHTYGCQMNVRDSEAVAALLRAHGYQLAASEAQADIVIVNTCSVRRKAEEKAWGKLGLLLAESRGTSRIVGAMGCMVERLGPAIAERLPGLAFALGTRRLASLPDALAAVQSGRGPVVAVGGDNPEQAARLTAHLSGAVSAFVSILFGCNRGCTYCIVPTVRGAEWSRPAVDVLAEIRGLAEAGVKEVTLLGQSVMSYGRANAVWEGAPPSPRGFTEPLPRLLEAVAAVSGIRRVRFTSGHPSGCTAELARAMAELPAVCDHLHLPLQSGSDRILERMRRGYTVAEYLAAVERLRAAVPTLALTTDVIVGFPGETAEDFERTRELMERVGFDNAFIFQYSPRPGTPAAAWVDDVPPEEKLRRNHVLLADQDRRGLAINRALVGRTLEVLVEGPSARRATRWTGRTTTDKVVIFEPRQGVPRGAIVPVFIERACPQTLHGRLADMGKATDA